MSDKPDVQPKLSKRGWATVEGILPKIKDVVAERSKKVNTNIDLSTAENWLLRPELIDICKDAIAQDLLPKHFSYPKGFSGDPELLEAYAKFFNDYFAPYTPVEPSHLATAPGAMACVDTLLYNICDPGEGILTPGPYWNGFDFGFRVRSSVTPVLVSLPSFDDNFSDKLIGALEQAYENATIPIKALIITNPHNPLAVCYPKSVLEACLRFCEKHDLHFISDEIYALSIFPNPEITENHQFVSALSINLDSIGVDPSRVHVVWSMSKDFGQSGFRMGVTVTQANPGMAVGLALAANTQTSSLSAICTIKLLSSPQLPSLMKDNAERLSIAYKTLTGFFKQYDIQYFPANAGLYVFARLIDAKTWEEEAEMISKLKAAGVLVSAGKAYHGPDAEKGWARVLFAVEPEVLQEAIRRMGTVYSGIAEKS
ncbi:PLP-dependent transferase [Aaosphaeria arxii CBS 175.79]|uniref:PLP-dependent transferase n=1 Tax=Aaosphaeria arxii CBS 175.79 TaxID=1450172 RepID=A0A6A5XNS8_9PLEO|nr:PLP-dependent transferase [Aaosphaeria arxii CBS 175.79]KAF2014421.1 PLP-dependent transferase [Aaosphaeria arxii CBS 175.79]